MADRFPAATPPRRKGTLRRRRATVGRGRGPVSPVAGGGTEDGGPDRGVAARLAPGRVHTGAKLNGERPGKGTHAPVTNVPNPGRGAGRSPATYNPTPAPTEDQAAAGAEALYSLSLTVGRELVEKLEEARAQLSHSLPDGDLARILLSRAVATTLNRICCCSAGRTIGGDRQQVYGESLTFRYALERASAATRRGARQDRPLFGASRAPRSATRSRGARLAPQGRRSASQYSVHPHLPCSRVSVAPRFLGSIEREDRCESKSSRRHRNVGRSCGPRMRPRGWLCRSLRRRRCEFVSSTPCSPTRVPRLWAPRPQSIIGASLRSPSTPKTDESR